MVTAITIECKPFPVSPVQNTIVESQAERMRSWFRDSSFSTSVITDAFHFVGSCSCNMLYITQQSEALEHKQPVFSDKTKTLQFDDMIV